MPTTQTVTTTLGNIAASTDPAPARGRSLLETLRAAVPFDAAWLAFTDPRETAHEPLAALDLHDDVLQVLAGSDPAPDTSAVPADRRRSPVSRRERPRPETEHLVWAGCLTPAGFHESLYLPLSTADGRRVGLLLLLFRDPAPPSRTVRRRLAELGPVLALVIDPMPSLLATTRLVTGVTAGTALRDDGTTQPLAGLDGDPLLVSCSPVLVVARERLDAGLCHSSFLWPLGDPLALAGHVQVTVVAAPGDSPASVLGTVLMSPSPDLRGLTPRELEVLGLVVLGHSNQRIASILVVAPRTVAAHLEHVLAKLDAGTRTTAAVCAEREGLYVPPLTSHRTDP